MIHYLFKAVPAYSLAVFRIGFGVLCALQLNNFSSYAYQISYSGFRIPWEGFEWVTPPAPENTTWLYGFFMLGAAGLALGLLYRISAFVTFIGLTYTVLLDVGLYNNHYYFFALLAFLFIVTDAHKVWSVDALLRKVKEPFVPKWNLQIFQLTIAGLYLFGAIAKINTDWLLNAEPTRTWLPEMLGDTYATLSANQIEVAAYFFAWSGFIIDLAVPFLLFHRKLKWVAIVALLAFHATNSQMFSIGLFPALGMASLVLLIAPELNAFLRKLRGPFPEMTLQFQPKKRITSFFIFWFGLHALLPFRHYLFPGDYRWTGSGYFYAWTMKLTDYNPIIRFEAKIEGEETSYDIEYFKVVGQSKKHMTFILASAWRTVWFANYCEAWLKEQNPRYRNKDIAIYCDSYLSMNNRPYQRKVNPNVDLTTLNLHPIKKYFQRQDWIIPLGSDTLVDREVLNQVLNSDT